MWDLIVSVPDHCLFFYFPMFLIQEHLSLSAIKVLKFICTVIRTVELYANAILLIEGS